MTIKTICFLIISSLLAGIGQILFRSGAADATSWKIFMNLKIFLGLSSYGLSTVLWTFFSTCNNCHDS